jgi:enoyl-CoA hydratase/carnithine racemase
MAVSYQAGDGVGVITLDRPPANSYEDTFVDELADAVQAAGADDGVAAVVVRSASDRFFSAGADVKVFAGRGADENMAMVRRAHAAFDAMSALPKVFVAEIAGHAIGGGLEIALACDLRFGADGSYRIGLPEVTLGLLPGSGGTQRLPRIIGRGRALDRMLTGQTMTPGEAFELGVLDRLVPAGELEATCREFAATLARSAPLAVAGVKRAVVQGGELPLADALQVELELVAPLFASADAQEGMRAFLEKRSPTFEGR